VVLGLVLVPGPGSSHQPLPPWSFPWTPAPSFLILLSASKQTWVSPILKSRWTNGHIFPTPNLPFGPLLPPRLHIFNKSA
jgi:hypothetical protein